MPNAGNLEIVISAVGAEDAVDKITKVKESVEKLGESALAVSALSISMQNLADAMTTYLTPALLALGTASVWAATRTDELKQALQNVGGQGKEQFATLAVEADKLGLGVESIAKAAIKLEVAGISNQTTLRVINGIGEAVRKMGGGDAQFTPIIAGLERIAATGHIAARQIKTMEAAAPEIKKVLLDAFSTDVPKALEALNLTTEEFFRKFADSASKLLPHVRTIKDSFTQLKNDTEVALGKIGDVLIKDFNLTGVLDSISKFIRSAIDAFLALPEPIRKAIEAITVVLAVGGPLMLAIAGIITIMPALASAFAIGFWPVTGIILGIGLLTAAGTVVYKNFETITLYAGYLKAGLEYVEVAVKSLAIIVYNLVGEIVRLTFLLTKGVEGWKEYGRYLDNNTAKAIGSTIETYKLAGATLDLTNNQLALNRAYADSTNLKPYQLAEPGKDGKTPVLEGDKIGGDAKAKIIKERIAEVKEISEAVSFAQLEADIRAAAARVLNTTRLTKIAFSDTIAGVLEGENKLKAFMNTLSIGTMPSIVKMGKDTATALKAGGQVSKQIGDAITDLNKQVSDIINQGMINVGVALGSGLGKAFEKGNFQDLGKGLLDTIGGIMTQLGAALITVGVGINAFKISLAGLNGPIAIAAGIALVAAGTVFTDIASAGASSTGGMSASATSNNSGGDAGNMNALSAMIANSNKMQLTTKIAGSDLIFIMNRANNSQNRTS